MVNDENSTDLFLWDASCIIKWVEMVKYSEVLKRDDFYFWIFIEINGFLHIIKYSSNKIRPMSGKVVYG